MPLDLSSFESNVQLRPLRAEDYDAVVALQARCFPKMAPWPRASFINHSRVFPEGQLAIEIDGRLVASASSLIVDSADYTDWHDWQAISGDGTLGNHDPEGDTLYGVEMQVDPEFRGMKLSRRLYDARKELCRRNNLARMVIGGRIPGYNALKDAMTPQEYVEACMERRIHDPVLTAQLANRFVLKQIVPDYLPCDEDSGGYATQLEWANLDYIPARHKQRQAVHQVRVAVTQYQMRSIADFSEFAKQVEFFVDTASDYRADFLLFPELFTLQLLSVVGNSRPGSAARSLAEFTPQYIELHQRLATRYNVNIIAGSQFTVEGDRLYNIAYLFRRDGSIATQKKIHVTPNEARWWGITGGSELRTFDTDCGRIGILVCYDVEFPELCRVIADEGARILFVPYNTNDRYGHLRVKHCAQARCIENHLYVVTAGAVGNLPFVENADIHYAQSGVYTPSDVSFARDGVAAEASPNIEHMLVQDIDTEALRRHRRVGTVQNWNDRRRDLYGVVWRGDEEPREV